MLTSNSVFLRELTLEDDFQIEAIASDIEVAQNTLTIPHPFPKGSAKEFIHFVLEETKHGSLVIYAIIEKKSNQLIGIINLEVNPVFRRGELGYWIAKEYWGKGYGVRN